MPRGKNTWVIDRFDGGISEGSKRGLKGSFRFGQGLDYKSDPDSLTGLRKLTKDSGSTVTDMIKWIVTEGTNTWFYGDTGKVYKRTTGGVWSLEKTVSSSSGNGMAVFDDHLYVTSDKALHRYGPLSGTPVWEDDFLTGEEPHINDNGWDPTNTYTIPVAISETAVNKYSFTPTADTVYKIIVALETKGSKDITCTLHDSSDNHIAETTIANADLTAAYVTIFTFDNPAQITSGNTYHIHFTSEAADSAVRTGTANDLSDLSGVGIEQDITLEDVDVFRSRIFVNEANKYDIPVAVTESELDKFSFVPDKYNISGISLYIRRASDASTYNWTLTLHDDENNSLGTATLTSNKVFSMTRFNFSSPISVTPGATYHIHLTVSASASVPTLVVSTNGDFETCFYKVHYQILDEDTDYHPMLFFPPSSSLVIGNGNFLANYDGITYRTSGQGDGSERIKLAKEEKVRSLDIVGDYLAMGTWKGDSIDDHGTSNLYFWDGTSTSINAFKPIVGETNAIKTGNDGLLYVLHGGEGNISIYDGGLTLVDSIPDIGENKYIETYPGAITNHAGIIKFGISDGDSTSATRGVYSYGRKSKNYSRSLNFEAPISTGTIDEDAQITALLGIGPDRFFAAWKDDTTYGVDLLSTTTDQSTTSYESLIFDAGIPHYEKKSSSIKLTFAALVSGQSIKIYTKEDRAASFSLLDTYNTVGQIVGSSAFDARWKELELKIELITTGNDSPTLLSSVMFFGLVTDEQE